MTKFILLDIEGTTTSIDFVHQVLFPYASAHLPAFVGARQDDPRVAQALEAVKATVLEEQSRQIDSAEAVAQLLHWIAEDRKFPALKALQGYLWREGYETGQYKGHVYPDVVPALRHWQQSGVAMGIYSSGSVAAQQLLFQYSDFGDLRHFFSGYFDTGVGHKRAAASYSVISSTVGIEPAHILFLSDVAEELDAALAAGCQGIQLVRPGTSPSGRHVVAADFGEVMALTA